MIGQADEPEPGGRIAEFEPSVPIIPIPCIPPTVDLNCTIANHNAIYTHTINSHNSLQAISFQHAHVTTLNLQTKTQSLIK